MYGFSETFDNVLTINNNIFVYQFKTRVIDTYKSEWFASIESYSVLDMYKIYKPLHGYECYLDIIPRSLRLFFTKLRVSVCPLRIQTGRHGRNYIPRNTRYCLCCRSLDIEDEFHFICICSYFSELRRKYIKRYIILIHQLLNIICYSDLIIKLNL